MDAIRGGVAVAAVARDPVGGCNGGGGSGDRGGEFTRDNDDSKEAGSRGAMRSESASWLIKPPPACVYPLAFYSPSSPPTFSTPGGLKEEQEELVEAPPVMLMAHPGVRTTLAEALAGAHGGHTFSDGDTHTGVRGEGVRIDEPRLGGGGPARARDSVEGAPEASRPRRVVIAVGPEAGTSHRAAPWMELSALMVPCTDSTSLESNMCVQGWHYYYQAFVLENNVCRSTLCVLYCTACVFLFLLRSISR